MESLPQTAPTITVSELTERVVATSHAEFELLLNALAAGDGKQINAVEKKRALMHYLNALKQRLVRLHALVSWAPKNAKATLVAENACNALEGHLEQFRVTADTLHGVHSRLLWARAPMFDVSASFDVLCRGGFDCLDRVEGIRKVAMVQKWKEQREKETKKNGRGAGDADAEEEEEGKESEEKTEEDVELARRKTLDAKYALLVEKHALKRFPSMDGEKFTVFDVVAGEVKCGVENMYEMTLVLDDAPTEEQVLWTCTGVEILCGEESMVASEENEDDGKRKRVSYQATKEEVKSLTFNATMRAKGDGTEQHPARGILGAHEAMMDAVTRLICAKTLAQAGVLRDLAEENSDKSAIEWTRRGKVIAEIVKHKGDVTGCAVTLWNARKRLEVKFEVDKRRITASVVSVEKVKEKKEKKDETAAAEATLPSVAFKTFENTREPVEFDNGTISLLGALDLASKTATISTLTSIRDFLVSQQKAAATPKKSPQKAKKATPAATKKRKAAAIEEGGEAEDEGENKDETVKPLSGVTISEIDADALTFSIDFDRDEVDKNNKELASVSATVSVNKYTGLVQCAFKATPDSIIDRDDVDDIICYGSFKQKLARCLESASETNDPQKVGSVFLEFLPETRKIAKMFVVRKYLEPSMRALFAPYSIEKLKETLDTTRCIADTNIAAIIKTDDDEHLLEKEGTFVCVWEDGATMTIKCAKRRSTLERWRVETCSEITRNGETLSGAIEGAGTKRAKTTKGKAKAAPSPAEGPFEGAATISIESLAKIATDAVKQALK